MRPPPDNGRGRGHHNPGLDTQQITATNGNGESIPDAGDPRRIGELLADWLAIRMAGVDDLVAEARTKVATLPDRRVLDQILGELVVRVRTLELDVAELKAAKR